MTIPDFQSLMLPLLEFGADGAEHTNRETIDALAERFGATPQEREKMLPSGRQRVFDNRIAWARAHMKMALLIENASRGVWRITQRGKDALAKKPSRIDLNFLMQFSEYVEKRNKQKNKPGDTTSQAMDSQTPEEQIERAHEVIRDELTEDILSQLKSSSPAFFEKVVVEVLVKMGYGGSRRDAGEAIGGAGDEGIDGIIKEDRLGFDIIYIQAKKWESAVSRPEIQKFAGALQGKRARKGVFITTSCFSQGARAYAASIENKIILIDGRELAQIMLDCDVGVSTEAVYEVKRLDSDYFVEA